MTLERIPGIPAAEIAPSMVSDAHAGPVRRPDDPRALQILTTEHWSLLATRALSWNESFSRASMLLATLAATVVALALVAQVSRFGEGFVMFALVALPFVLFIGLTTFVRLGQANGDDLFCVQGMNRLRHAYLEIAPDLEPYFVTSAYDDPAGVLATIGGPAITKFSMLGGLLHGFVTTQGMIGVINAMVAAVIGGLVAIQLAASTGIAIVSASVFFALVFIGQLLQGARDFMRIRRRLASRFPTPPSEPPT